MKISLNKNFDSKKCIDIIVNIIPIIIILLGIILSLYMLIVRRTLWLDEAAFAYSFSQRNFINLTFGVLEWEQTAPIIYMYIVKIITIIFGNNEITLRVFSFISYIILLVLTYIIAKKIFKMKYPLFPTAYVASMQFILKYSNNFKVYIFDAVMCLFIIYIYYLYNEDKISFKKLMIIFMISIWASNPCCFFIGGVLLYEFIIAIKEKKYDYLKKIVIGALGILFSFVIYYFYWLKTTANSPAMQEFWNENNFPLIPTSIQDLNRINTLFNGLINAFDNYSILIVCLATIALIIEICRKNKYSIIIIISIFISLFASYIKKFPMQDRMWLFIYPIFSILAFDFINIIYNIKIKKFKTLCSIILLVICLILVLSNKGLIEYKDNLYLDRCEVNSLLEYLQNNIKEDEKVFVFNEAVPTFKYKNGYNKNTFLDRNNEIIYPKYQGMFLTNEEESVEVDDVLKGDKIYLVTEFYPARKYYNIEKLIRNGYLELVINPYNTPLYYYVKDARNMKSRVKYKVKEAKYEDSEYILTLSITNTGETIINHDFETICLSSRQDDTIKALMNGKLYQEQTCDLSIKLNFDKTNEYELQLYSVGNYWYDEIGIEPIKVNKNMFKK